MVYCFDKSSPWDYSKMEMKITSSNGTGILYDGILHTFTDFNGKNVNVKGKVIFPRAGIIQAIELKKDVISQGGSLIVSSSSEAKVDNWPKYYKDKKHSRVIKGKNLVNPDIVEKIRNTYGEEIFFETKNKNFSGIIPVELLLDRECAFYKALLYHLDDDFIISKKVNILEDEYGQKEYRFFVINNEVYNISRCTTSILHRIDSDILNEGLRVIESLKGVFPGYYVVDLMEYELDKKRYIDVVEFNTISSSGLYLYNSCLKKSSDLLHQDINKIAEEFADNIDKCSTLGKVLSDASILYNMKDSFANHLRSICLYGTPEMGNIRDFDICNRDFARTTPIIDFSKMISLDDNFLGSDEDTLGDIRVVDDLSLETPKKLLLRKENKG